MTSDEGLNADRYLEGEVTPAEGWYDARASRAKVRFLRWRVFSVVGGALVPVLANLPLETKTLGYPLKTLLITALSLGVVIAVSLEGVFHYGDQWRNFRTAQATLRRERVQFKSRTGPYSKLADEAAFRLLVERIEAARAAETSSTLSVMATADKGETEGTALHD
jgi:hypothetical protein